MTLYLQKKEHKQGTWFTPCFLHCTILRTQHFLVQWLMLKIRTQELNCNQANTGLSRHSAGDSIHAARAAHHMSVQDAGCGWSLGRYCATSALYVLVPGSVCAHCVPGGQAAQRLCPPPREPLGDRMVYGLGSSAGTCMAPFCFRSVKHTIPFLMVQRWTSAMSPAPCAVLKIKFIATQ